MNFCTSFNEKKMWHMNGMIVHLVHLDPDLEHPDLNAN